MEYLHAALSEALRLGWSYAVPRWCSTWCSTQWGGAMCAEEIKKLSLLDTWLHPIGWNTTWNTILEQPNCSPHVVPFGSGRPQGGEWWRMMYSRWNSTEEGDESSVRDLRHGKNGGHIGEGLSAVQVGAVATRRSPLGVYIKHNRPLQPQKRPPINCDG
ncbi:hypothetical protein OROGR_012539 [Orobanche gracilis]